MNEAERLLEELRIAEQENDRLKQRYQDVSMQVMRCDLPKGHPERMELNVALREVMNALGDSKRNVTRKRLALTDERQQVALRTMGVEASVTSALRGAVTRVGRLEHVYLSACRYVDNPTDANLRQLAGAVQRIRGN